MRWITIAVQVVLGLLFLFSAASKLTGGVEDMRLHLGIAPWFWALTAIVETVGAIGLLAGIRLPRLAVFAGLWLGATMLGAIVSHLLVADPLTDALAAIVLVLLSLSVVALNWRAGRIGALLATRPRATNEPQPVVR